MTYLWEPRAAGPALQSVSGLEECQGDRLVVSARMDFGDTEAVAAWARLIKKRVTAIGFQTLELSPLWMFPANHVLGQVAESLFAHLGSPLAPDKAFDRINSPLLAVAAYRRAVLSALGNRSALGLVSTTSDGWLSIRAGNSIWSRLSEQWPDAKGLTPGKELPVRVMDMVAFELSDVDGFPLFQPYWPEAAKDRAAAEMADFLRKRGNEMRAYPDMLGDIACFPEQVYLKK